MQIAVIGAGGVGGTFGARLALAGHAVQFLARGAHLAAMRTQGLRIATEAGDTVLPHPAATDDPADLRPADVVLVATKLWDLAATGRQIAAVVQPHTVVIPFQNGVDAVDLLAQSLPAERVAAGVAYISAVISAPGVITQTGSMARLRVGALHPAQQAPLAAFAEAGTAAGFGCDLVAQPQHMLWEKFVGLNALAALTAATRQPLGVIRADPDLRAMLVAVLREGIALAAAHGVHLAPELEARSLATMDSLPHAMRASMAHDLLAGRRLEAPWLCGAVVRRAAGLGLPVPVNAALWATLKPWAQGTPGSA